MDEKAELLKNLDEKIKSGHEMIDKLNKLKGKIDGVDKLSRKINQELKFLDKVRSADNLKKEYLQSTNLIHLSAVVKRLLTETAKLPSSKRNHLMSVMKPFKIDSCNRLLVDIITDVGNSWIKVIARNPKALTLISLGNGEYGQKSILDQANSFLNCASLHPNCFKIPRIIFHFACGIENILATKLEELGIFVEGKRIENDADDDLIVQLNNQFNEFNEFNESSYRDNSSIINYSSSSLIKINKIDYHDTENGCKNYPNELNEFHESLEATEELKSIEIMSLQEDLASIKLLTTKTLNLDVSTLLAYVSNMTNGYADLVFLEPLLTLQAEWERSRPLKIVLDKWFDGKPLLVCQTAYKNFMDIIDTIGGKNETERAQKFMRRVRIVEDAKEGRILQLPIGGKIKPRSRMVFATGEFNKSITVSANEGFVRAASMQGIECPVLLHEPRSLSEIKEKYAKKSVNDVDTDELR